MAQCHGICKRLNTQFPITDRRYTEGRKRCCNCNVFIETEKIHCPCCRLKLRTRPRLSKCKQRYLEDLPRVS